MSDQSRPRAVVADDDIDLRPLLEALLSKAGFEVEACADGREALAAIRRIRPHIAVLDVTMPGLSGPEVIAEVRADGSLRSCRILLLTGHVLEPSLTAGADDQLAKPFSPRELVTRVQALAASLSD